MKNWGVGSLPQGCSVLGSWCCLCSGYWSFFLLRMSNKLFYAQVSYCLWLLTWLHLFCPSHKLELWVRFFSLFDYAMVQCLCSHLGLMSHGKCNLLVPYHTLLFCFCFLSQRYTQFVHTQGLKDSQCIVFAHHRPSAADTTRTQLRKMTFYL